MNPEKSAVLVAGYSEWHTDRPGKPDVFARLSVLAASEVYRQGGAEVVVFTTGSVAFGEPSISDTMAAQLQRNLPKIPEADVIAENPNPPSSTRKELRTFKKLAQENGWDNLLIIGKEAHLSRIKREAGRILGRDFNVTVKSAEEVLNEGSPWYRAQKLREERRGYSLPEETPNRYRKILEKVTKSPQQETFRKRERIINAIDAIPLVGGQLLDFIERLMGNKDLLFWVTKLLAKR